MFSNLAPLTGEVEVRQLFQNIFFKELNEISRSVQKIHISPRTYSHECGVRVRLPKNLLFPGKYMICPELHIPHVWQHHPMEQGGS